MTLTRATGPGPRTVALPPPARLLLCVLVAVVFVAGCGGGPASPSGRSPGLSSAGAGAPSSSAGPDATPPRWPGTTVLAVIALGAADGEIQKAGIDLQAAAAKPDLSAMLGAADGLARLIDNLTPNIERLEAYEGTRSVAAMYRKAFPQLAAGAKQLRDALTSGDAAGVESGSQQIARGLAAYAPIRREIAALVDQAIIQQRLLLK